jgi:hypothetical protein
MKGGKREGAGRKPGSLTRRNQDIAEKVLAEGESPLEFMLRTMRDENAPIANRLDMAKSAAPYVHPRLASTEHTGKDGGPLVVQVMDFAKL